jgi:signal transduction histidine kinase
MYEDITFIKEISPHLGFVNIDKIHFQQVITNLLENAIKFANAIDPVILIECSHED